MSGLLLLEHLHCSSVVLVMGVGGRVSFILMGFYHVTVASMKELLVTGGVKIAMRSHSGLNDLAFGLLC